MEERLEKLVVKTVKARTEFSGSFELCYMIQEESAERLLYLIRLHHPDTKGEPYDRYEVMKEIGRRGLHILFDLGWPGNVNHLYKNRYTGTTDKLYNLLKNCDSVAVEERDLSYFLFSVLEHWYPVELWEDSCLFPEYKDKHWGYKMKISDIIIGDRARQDFGDMDRLVESIKKIGLICPVIVDTEGYLIDGQRRIKAFQMMGLDEIPAVVRDISDLFTGEAESNIQRKNFSIAEALVIAEKIEKRIKAFGEVKVSNSLKAELGQVPESVTNKYRVRKAVEKATGVGHSTLSQAKAVVKAAEENPDLAPLVQKMDEESVNAAYQEMRSKKAQEEEDRLLSNQNGNRPAVGKVLPVVIFPDGRRYELSHLVHNRMRIKEALVWISEQVANHNWFDDNDIILSRHENTISIRLQGKLDLQDSGKNK